MQRTSLRGKWEHEPIFPSTGSMKKDGTFCAYFSHMVYDGEYAHTVRAEEIGPNMWEAIVEDADGELVHRMSDVYAAYYAAIDDALNWAAGQ